MDCDQRHSLWTPRSKGRYEAGVRGMAVLGKGWTKTLCIVMGAVQVALLAFVGRWNGFSGVWYFGLVVRGTGLALGWLVWAVDLSCPRSCGVWFKRQFWMVGLPGILGLAGEYYFGNGK
ncbi:hypothetical protein QBC37DRAFT_419999 [Rhypophila decipiens]|uniref:Uncharacterized protein n=1 Tax=Rhypophila decipiens TaxID=261697 RepID=A0AAN6YF58_9PEZI|nr:hypothetical protein QBC37DRAFT_419999 [Rhypophila decipiens]